MEPKKNSEVKVAQILTAPAIKKLVEANKPFKRTYGFVLPEVSLAGRLLTFLIYWEGNQVCAQLLAHDSDGNFTHITIDDNFHDRLMERMERKTGIKTVRAIKKMSEEESSRLAHSKIRSTQITKPRRT